MAKKKDDDFDRKLFGYLLAAYVADAVHFLDAGKLAKLDELGRQHGDGETWQQHIENDLSIDQNFVRAVFDLAAGTTGGWKGPQYGPLFVLKGLGCPEPEERLKEVFG